MEFRDKLQKKDEMSRFFIYSYERQLQIFKNENLTFVSYLINEINLKYIIMNKWADYLISHVKRDSNGVVIKVLLHKDNGDSTSVIGIKTKDEVIDLLKKKYSIKTILWIYPNWSIGADVHFVKSTHGEYLRTDRNKTSKDNLDNLIPLY